MASGKRVLSATILGIIAGVLCYLMARGSIDPYPTWMVITTVLNRSLIGFAIGASGLKWHWAGHGIFWGVLISLLMAIPAWGEGDAAGFFLLMVAGAVWGFLIELFTSKILKAPVAQASRS